MKLIEEKYAKHYIVRYDKEEFIKYFDINDFPGLLRSPFQIKTNDGDIINGYYYNYEKYDDNKLVVFSSGIGPGHSAYMTEINTLCKEGFQVLAYDNVGCDISTGRNIKAMSNSIACLDLVLSSLNTDKEITCVGHSWGAYAVTNIYKFHKEVKKIVAISPFLSIKELVKQSTKWYERIAVLFVSQYEKKINSKYALYDSRKSLKNSDAQVLWFHSTNDYMVNYKYSFLKAKKALKKENIEFISFDNKGHNPNYTEDAVHVMNTLFKEFNELVRNGKINSIEEKKAFFKDTDWNKIVEQDMNVWGRIFELIRR